MSVAVYRRRRCGYCVCKSLSVDTNMEKFWVYCVSSYIKHSAADLEVKFCILGVRSWWQCIDPEMETVFICSVATESIEQWECLLGQWLFRGFSSWSRCEEDMKNTGSAAFTVMRSGDRKNLYLLCQWLLKAFDDEGMSLLCQWLFRGSSSWCRHEEDCISNCLQCSAVKMEKICVCVSGR